MAYYFMPVRAENDPVADDWVCWSTYVDNPVARGTRAELNAWWRELFGTEGLRSLEVSSPFERGDEYGSSSSGGDGRWGTTLGILGYGLLGIAQLDRDKLPAFIAAAYPHPHSGDAEGDGRGAAEVGRAVRALVTPFDPAEDPEIDLEVWKIQQRQAIADFDGGYDQDKEG
jgi:hypothetical protein